MHESQDLAHQNRAVKCIMWFYCTSPGHIALVCLETMRGDAEGTILKLYLGNETIFNQKVIIKAVIRLSPPVVQQIQLHSIASPTSHTYTILGLKGDPAGQGCRSLDTAPDQHILNTSPISFSWFSPITLIYPSFLMAGPVDCASANYLDLFHHD